MLGKPRVEGAREEQCTRAGRPRCSGAAPLPDAARAGTRPRSRPPARGSPRPLGAGPSGKARCACHAASRSVSSGKEGSAPCGTWLAPARDRETLERLRGDEAALERELATARSDAAAALEGGRREAERIAASVRGEVERTRDALRAEEAAALAAEAARARAALAEELALARGPGRAKPGARARPRRSRWSLGSRESDPSDGARPAPRARATLLAARARVPAGAGRARAAARRGGRAGDAGARHAVPARSGAADAGAPRSRRPSGRIEALARDSRGRAARAEGPLPRRAPRRCSRGLGVMEAELDALEARRAALAEERDAVARFGAAAWWRSRRSATGSTPRSSPRSTASCCATIPRRSRYSSGEVGRITGGAVRAAPRGRSTPSALAVLLVVPRALRRRGRGAPLRARGGRGEAPRRATPASALVDVLLLLVARERGRSRCELAARRGCASRRWRTAAAGRSRRARPRARALLGATGRRGPLRRDALRVRRHRLHARGAGPGAPRGRRGGARRARRAARAPPGAERVATRSRSCSGTARGSAPSSGSSPWCRSRATARPIPTPWLAVFFPLFFGLVLGDVAFGALGVVVALVLRVRGPAACWGGS